MPQKTNTEKHKMKIPTVVFANVELPIPVLAEIFSHLDDPKDRINIARTSKKLREAVLTEDFAKYLGFDSLYHFQAAQQLRYYPEGGSNIAVRNIEVASSMIPIELIDPEKKPNIYIVQISNIKEIEPLQQTFLNENNQRFKYVCFLLHADVVSCHPIPSKEPEKKAVYLVQSPTLSRNLFNKMIGMIANSIMPKNQPATIFALKEIKAVRERRIDLIEKKRKELAESKKRDEQLKIEEQKKRIEEQKIRQKEEERQKKIAELEQAKSNVLAIASEIGQSQSDYIEIANTLCAEGNLTTLNNYVEHFNKLKCGTLTTSDHQKYFGKYLGENNKRKAQDEERRKFAEVEKKRRIDQEEALKLEKQEEERRNQIQFGEAQAYRDRVLLSLSELHKQLPNFFVGERNLSFLNVLSADTYNPDSWQILKCRVRIAGSIVKLAQVSLCDTTNNPLSESAAFAWLESLEFVRNIIHENDIESLAYLERMAGALESTIDVVKHPGDFKKAQQLTDNIEKMRNDIEGTYWERAPVRISLNRSLATLIFVAAIAIVVAATACAALFCPVTPVLFAIVVFLLAAMVGLCISLGGAYLIEQADDFKNKEAGLHNKGYSNKTPESFNLLAKESINLNKGGFFSFFKNKIKGSNKPLEASSGELKISP